MLEMMCFFPALYIIFPEMYTSHGGTGCVTILPLAGFYLAGQRAKIPH